MDAALLPALQASPDATNLALAERTGLARNTVRSRLARYNDDGVLFDFDRRIDPAFLGYPLRAYIFTKVKQRALQAVGEELARVREVIQVQGLTGMTDLLVHVVAIDADDLYRIAGRILDIKGVKRTTTALVMRTLVDHRVLQLLPSDPRARV